MIHGEAGREDETQPTVRAQQSERALHEQLIQVDVAVALQPIDTGSAHEVGHAGSRESRLRARAGGAVVAAQHLPGWIAEDGVEARRIQGTPCSS